MVHGLRRVSRPNSAKKQRSLRPFVRSFSRVDNSHRPHFFRWSAIGFFLNAHACGAPPSLAHQTAHSNLLVDRDCIRSLLGITVILQSEEQGYAFIKTD